MRCFNTQPPEGGWKENRSRPATTTVSTHSRPKAAGPTLRRNVCLSRRFNTQPPEGGWVRDNAAAAVNLSFNTQPPEGGWVLSEPKAYPDTRFQHTAARRRLVSRLWAKDKFGGFNTQPPEGGWAWLGVAAQDDVLVSTHSRPKAAGIV